MCPAESVHEMELLPARFALRNMNGDLAGRLLASRQFRVSPGALKSFARAQMRSDREACATKPRRPWPRRSPTACDSSGARP